jgi:putative two-component system response regulator
MTDPLASPWPKARVLIVDDEAQILRAFERMLETLDLVVDCAETGEEAAALLARETYHAILTDVSMPGMNGVDLLRAIRKSDLDTPEPAIRTAP